MSTITKELVTLKPLLDLDRLSQLAIREIRNESDVRKWMYTDHVISQREHEDWLSRLEADDRQIVFAVLDKHRAPIGVVSVNAIDYVHKKADWAYYLSEKVRGGLGAALEYQLIDFVFLNLGIEKLNCEVIDGNDRVIKLHNKFMFSIEGYRQSNIIKDGGRKGVHFLGLTKEIWITHRENIYSKYQRIFDAFSINLVNHSVIQHKYNESRSSFSAPIAVPAG